jgi:hypothetical protein
MDEVGQPFWVYRLTSGVGARRRPDLPGTDDRRGPLALRLNGGSGGTLSIAGIALASARPGHARLFQPPMLIAAATVGILAVLGLNFKRSARSL